MDSALVIKVKYGDILRRFTPYVDENGLLDLNIVGLKVKIRSLFKFAPDVDLILTYFDEDNDVVTLVDDEDLFDAIGQGLNPLRINVLLNSIRAGRSGSKVNRTYTPKGSVRFEHPSSHIIYGIPDILKIAQESISDAFSKLSHELATKATSLVLTKLVESLSKLESSCVGAVSECQDGARFSRNILASEYPISSEEAENQESLKDMAKPEVLLNAKPVDTNPENFQKELETGNMARVVGTSVPPTTAPLDLRVVLGKEAIASTDSNMLIHSPISASDALSDDREKVQKENDSHISGSSNEYDSSASSNSVLTHVNMHPFQGSMTAVTPDRGFCTLNGDNIKKVFSGTDQSSALQAGFNPHNISLNSGQNGVDSCDAVPSRYHPFKNSYTHGKNICRIFHKGIRCNGCGVHPIIGPRHKSKVIQDYDLCSICFSNLGNEADYVRLDHAVPCRSPRASKDFYDHHPWFQTPSLSHALQGCEMKPCRQKFDSFFVRDVNVKDGTVMGPNVTFTKIWKMCNSGSTAWPLGTQLVWIGGDQLTNRVSVEVEIPVDGFPVDKELDIAVDFTAPEEPGGYISSWRMSLPSGRRFGQPIWSFIKVDPSHQDSVDTVHKFNFKIYPETSSTEGKEILDVNVEPVEGNLPQTGQSKVTAEVLKQNEVVDNRQSYAQKLPSPWLMA